LEGKQYSEAELGTIIDKDGALGIREGKLWVDAVFKVPAGQTPVAFQFKQNATVSLLGLTQTPTTPEIERELDAEKETEGDLSQTF